MSAQQLQQMQQQQQQDHIQQRNHLLQQQKTQQQNLQLRITQLPPHILPDLIIQQQNQLQGLQLQHQQMQQQFESRQQHLHVNQPQSQVNGMPQVSQSAAVVAVKNLMSLSPTASTGPSQQPPHLSSLAPQISTYGSSGSSGSSSINNNSSGYYQQSSSHATSGQLPLIRGSSLPIGSHPSTFNQPFSTGSAANGIATSATSPTAGASTPAMSKGATVTAQKKEYWLNWLQTEERCATIASREMDHYARILVRKYQCILCYMCMLYLHFIIIIIISYVSLYLS